MSKSILIVEDEETLRESIRRIFTKEGYIVDTTGTAEEALTLVGENFYDIIITDIILPGMDGLEMLERVKELHPEQIFIVITAYASIDTAVKALRLGAYDYIMKPIIHEEIKQVVRNAITEKNLKAENRLLKQALSKEYDFSKVIGESKQIKAVLEEIKKIADSKSNVLLLGETGTGKELFARVIHNNSSRADMPFVPINCSAIPESLLESELFGHIKGSFTGAVTNKKGLFEEADGGTVFLDEIGDLPPSFQVKLLRVLEDQMVRPVGSTKFREVDIRFITATNRNLYEAVKEGRFREDLYYRINVITLELPPLRDRKEDIPLLARYYLNKYTRDFGKEDKELTPEALSLLVGYRWPGNIRELQNVLERAVLISEGRYIKPEHFPDNIRMGDSFVEDSLKKGLSIEEYTRAFILKYQHVYSEQELADRLGITRKTLWEKRKKLGIKKP
ncbi:MAG TPA: sigma-54-dependent Fis family transcriptional regulator [Nitrospirae bacterium]|nr:sigma-54-dependent Fis family transcriptional regulator [Nitrospirota bacterium]